MKKKNPYNKDQLSMFGNNSINEINFINMEAPQTKTLENGSQTELSEYEFGLRSLLKKVLDDVSKRKENPLDRIDVAAGMTRILGRDITKTSLDQWVAMSTPERRIHTDSLKALCEVCNDKRLIHYFVESCGLKALSPEMAICAEYGARKAMMDKMQKGLKDLQNNLDNPKLQEKLLKMMTGGSDD